MYLVRPTQGKANHAWLGFFWGLTCSFFFPDCLATPAQLTTQVNYLARLMKPASRLATSSVVPVSAFGPPSLSSSPIRWVYQVQAAHQLPRVDLSITLKSRFLWPAADKWLDQWFGKYAVFIIIGYVSTCLLYVAVVSTPTNVGQILAIIGLIVGLPATLCTVGALRYEVVKVLVLTFDVLFTGIFVSATLGILMATLPDARMLIFMEALVVNHVNIFLDANIVMVRRITIVNAFASLCFVCVGWLATLDMVSDMRDFVIFQHGTHLLEARVTIANGFVTLITLMLRTAYRKRAVFCGNANNAVIECVSYRCSLMLTSTTPVMCTTTQQSNAAHVKSSPQVQRMRYLSSIPLIDAVRVVIPWVFQWFVVQSTSVKRTAIRLTGWAAILTSIVTSFMRIMDLTHSRASAQTADPLVAVAVGLTSVYTTTCFALCQRQLLSELCTSFDFVFLLTQVIFVHLATADFFRWRSSCLLLVLTWLWSLWVLCVDALTPIARERIGLTLGSVRFVTTMLFLSALILEYFLIFSDSSTDIYDRIVWSGRVFGREIKYCMLPSFYSCSVTVLAWTLRVLWRTFRAKRNELIMMDGQVAYDNYLRR